MTSLLRWSAAGLVAAGLLAALDLLVTLPAPPGSDGTSIAAALIALHLSAGLLAGVGMGVASLLLSGLTVDRLGDLFRRFFAPLRIDRPRHAAMAFATPIVVAATCVLLFGINVRFFRFNNPVLASLVLVLVTAIVLLLAAGAWKRIVEHIEPVARRAGQRRPNLGDSVGLWLMPGLGLVLGGLVGLALARFNTLAENWEAIGPAPYLGLLALAVLAGLLEVTTRRGEPRLIIALGVAMALTCAGAWTVALGDRALGGVENQAVHDDAWVGGLYLGLAERATDRDGDGFSARFGHGDCDDGDPDAWPGSLFGDDCGPDVPLEEAVSFRARLRGPESGAPAAPEPPSKVPAEPAPQAPVELAPSPEAPTRPPPLPEAEPEPQLKRPYNLLLITLDTVRADHCGFMGYERDTTPALDALAARSVVFERALAPSNLTPASVPAMMSGHYPTELFRDESHFIHFGAENRFVAETLSDAGFQTRAILTHWYFERRKRSGLDQGFAVWKVLGTRWGKAMEDASTSKLVSDEAIEQLAELRRSERPWLLWLHYLDPHKWYVQHPDFDRTWGRKSVDRYDHEIAFTDHHLGRVLRHLAAGPDADDTAIVVTSDHGEAFGEHGKRFHGHALYRDQLHVPLIVHVPGLDPARIDVRRGLIDLVPTLLDLGGVEAPERLQGVSWTPDLLGTPLPQRLVYAERPRGPWSRGLRMLIDGDWMIHWRGAGNRYELYDLADDPEEARDLFTKRPDAAKRMQSTLQSMVRLGLDTAGKVSRKR